MIVCDTGPLVAVSNEREHCLTDPDNELDVAEMEKLFLSLA